MSEEASVELKVVWSGVESLEARAANQFLMQQVRSSRGVVDEIVLIAGHLAPPVTLGPIEEQRAEVEALGSVVVKPVARLSMTVERARELRDLFVRVLEQVEAGVER